MTRQARPVGGWFAPLVSGLICASPALLVWPLLFPERLDYIATNQRDAAFTWHLLVAEMVSILLVGSLYLYRLLRSEGAGLAGKLETLRSCNAALLVLLACPLLAALAVPRIEEKDPFFTLALILATSLLAGSSVYHWARAVRKDPSPSQKGWPWVICGLTVLALVVAYSILLSEYSILNHRSFRVSSYDLAIYDNLVWNTSHGNFLVSQLVKGGTHMSAHFDPILLLLAPVYLLAPNAETLLIVQSVWLASGAIPLFFLASRVTRSSWPALVIAGAYLLHPALHGINMYEFHSLALVVPLLLWVVYLLERQKIVGYWVVLALILATREDMALLACCIGVYAVVAARRPITGVATIVIALLYLLLVKNLVMPDPGLFMSGKGGSYAYAEFYADMIPRKDGGAIDLLLTLVTNPIYSLRVALAEGKLLFLLQIMIPVLFLPLAARGRRILLLYGLAFCLLASRKHIYSIYYQYSSTLLPFVFALLPFGFVDLSESRLTDGLGLDKRRMRTALIATVAVASILMSWKFGALTENAAFRIGSWRSFHFERAEKLAKYEPRYHFLLAEVLPRIPASASVTASRVLLPFVSNRETAYTYPLGQQADYQLVYLRGLSKEALRSFEQRRASGRFEEVIRGEGIVLLRKIPAASSEPH